MMVTVVSNSTDGQWVLASTCHQYTGPWYM
jgi:hypothetical protein